MTRPEDQPPERPFSADTPAPQAYDEPAPTTEYVDLDSLGKPGQTAAPEQFREVGRKSPPDRDFDPEILSSEDQERLQACRERFTDTYLTYGRMITSYARRVCWNSWLSGRAEDEDVTQEVWEAYWKNIVLPGKGFENDKMEQGWLFSVARNKAIDKMRGRTRGMMEVPTEIIEEPPEVLSFEEEYGAARLGYGTAVRIQFARDLFRVIRPQDRELLWRAYEWKQRRAEIYEEMDTMPSVGAVRVSLTRARQKVLAHFAHEQRKYGLDPEHNDDLPAALAELLGQIMLIEDPPGDEANPL